MINKTYILSVLAILGIVSFFVFRPYIDFTTGAPIEQSKNAVEAKSAILAQELGFSVDSLGLFTIREQHFSYYNFLKDTLSDRDFVYPQQFNERGAHLNTWVTSIAAKDNTNLNQLSGSTVFANTGRLQFRYNNEGNVIRVYESQNNINPTFVSGDSLSMIANKVVGDILSYNLNNYELTDIADEDTLSNVEVTDEDQEFLFQEKSELGNSIEYSWVKRNRNLPGPEYLSLKLKPVIKEFKEEYGARVEFGASVEKFIAKNSLEPENLNENYSEEDDFLNFAIVQIVFVFIVAILGLIVGVRSIAKGEVVWGRALFMFTSITIVVWGWRAIYYINTFNDIVGDNGSLIFNLNQFLFGLLMGIFAAAVYLGWESTSRKTFHNQLPVIDALWNRKFFMKEIGEGLIKGYLLAGILIGVFTLCMFFFEERIIQADSQFGFGEATNSPKLLTINMSAWSTVFIVSLSQIGLVYNLFTSWIKKEWVRDVLAALTAGLFLTFVGRLIGTTASMYIDMVAFMIMGCFAIYFYKNYGLLSVSIGWWVFTVLFLITPYMNSKSIDIAYIVWVEAFIIMGPLLFGFISYKYGNSVLDFEAYIPEYQSRQAEVMRVEKEIEIARESQYNLMPLQPPKGEGFDVHGFFLPSFEVGGDFYDYVYTKNKGAGSDTLTMTVVDVSGKAMRAAMPAVFTSGLLLSRMHADNPSEILREVTGPLYHRTDAKTFVTCIISKLEIDTKRMITSNAGHCFPVLKRDGKAEFIKTPDPRYPLGIKEEVDYECQETQLQEGDLVVFYSDGLPEASDVNGNWFGFENVTKMIQEMETDSLTAYEISQEIKRRIQKFSNYNLEDDTTIICLKV